MVAKANAASTVSGTNSMRRASEPVPAGLAIGIPVNNSGGSIAPSELTPAPKTPKWADSSVEIQNNPKFESTKITQDGLVHVSKHPV